MKRLGFVVLALLVALVALSFHPEGRWRARLLRLQLAGDLEGVSWGEAGRGLLDPHLWPSDAHPLVRGSVVLEGIDPDDATCPARWSTPMGPLWGRRGDERVLEQFVGEQLDERIYDHDGARVLDGDLVLDVGGHLGTFSRFALVHGARRVVVFEPEPVNAACLRKTFRSEIAEGRIEVVEAAAWSEPTTLTFDVDDTVNSGAGRVTEGGKLQVTAERIDDIVARLGLERVDFVKMDIEGAERYALAGATTMLSRWTPRMAICVYHRLDDREVLPAFVTSVQPAYAVEATGSQAYFYPRSGA